MYPHEVGNYVDGQPCLISMPLQRNIILGETLDLTRLTLTVVMAPMIRPDRVDTAMQYERVSDSLGQSPRSTRSKALPSFIPQPPTIQARVPPSRRAADTSI